MAWIDSYLQKDHSGEERELEARVDVCKAILLEDPSEKSEDSVNGGSSHEMEGI